MLKARLVKSICQQWITPALGPKLIGSREEGEDKPSIAQCVQKKGLCLRCEQLNLFGGHYRPDCFIDYFPQLLMAAREMVKQM